MYVRPAKTQVSLCIDPLDKTSLDSPESKEGAYCTISEGSDQNVLLQSHCFIPLWIAQVSKVNTFSECFYQNMQLADWHESSLVAQDILLNPEIVGGTYD